MKAAGGERPEENMIIVRGFQTLLRNKKQLS